MQVHTTKQTNSKTKPYKMNINFLSVSIDSNIKEDNNNNKTKTMKLY